MDVVESKCHTPFCRKDCQTVHHGLIRALCIERNRKESKPRLSSAGNSHVILRQCVQLYEDNGWNRNSSVPDDLPDLRKPLVYLTCAFGKHRVLETLLSMNFDPSVVTRDGENGLHGLVNHFYRVGNMKQCGGFMVIDKRLEVFEKVVRTLSTRDPNVFSAKENRNGRTPLHVVALSVVSCSNGDARVDGRCDPLKKTRYFQRCLEVMVGHLLELKSNSLITLSQLSNAIMAQDNDGNTIIHILAKSSCVPSWESIGKVLKDFPDSELPLMKNKESKTAFDLLSSLNMEVARKLFFPEDYHEGRVDESITDTGTKFSPLNSELPHSPVAFLSPVTTSAPRPEVAVEAVWSQAKQVQECPQRGAQLGLCPKSLESVVLSLHTAAKRSNCMGTPTSSNHHDGISVDVVAYDGQLDSFVTTSNEFPAQNICENLASQEFLNDEPYPVFLPNISESEADCTNSSMCGVTKQEVDLTFSPCCVSSPSQNSLEVENHVPLAAPDSETREFHSEECSASCSMSNGHSGPESMGESISEKHLDNPEEEKLGRKNAKGSSAGDSAFFDFLLTQGSEFNPSMKVQIVELIKSEFGKKMANFNTEIFKTEMEKRRLEAEIRNSKVTLQQKEEEKLRLFAEIDDLQRNIEQATEQHKVLVQKCSRLKEESIAVKRKISSCEDVERELCGSPSKSSK